MSDSALRSVAFDQPVGQAPGFLSNLTDSQILAVWAEAMDELRRREVVRSSNNPTGDYAEYLVATHLGFKLEGNSTAGYDAIDDDGRRYQIKARRLVTSKTSRQLSPLRNLDQHHFDDLIVVLFDRAFNILELWQFPIDLVRDFATYRPHVNGHVLHAKGAVLQDPRAKQLDVFAQAN